MRKLTAHEIRRLAVEAEADPRTVQAFLEGRAGRPLTTDRIRRAVTRLGYDAPPQPADGPTPQPEAKVER